MTEEEIGVFKKLVKDKVEKDKQIEELKKENEEWKAEWNDQVIKANEEGFARTQLQIKNKELEAQITTLSQNLDDAMSVENALNKRNEELEAQIEKMKSDIKQLREDRMNDDTDQNIMDRLWEEWNVNFGVSN